MYEEQIRRWMKGNTYMVYSHIGIETVEPGRAVLFMRVEDDNMNVHNTAHGGALYTLADSAAGVAAHTDGGEHVTQNSTFNYFKPGRHGDTLRAEGRVRRRGRTTSYVEVDVTDSKGQLLCTGGFTYFRVGDKFVT